MIEIRKWIKPDLTIVLPKPDSSYASSTHIKYSIIFKDGLLVTTECGEDGYRKYNDGNKYYGLKIIEDKIEVCIPKFGWIPVYEEIQNAYNSETVDKIVLGD